MLLWALSGCREAGSSYLQTAPSAQLQNPPTFHISLLKRAVVTLTIDAILPKEFTLEEVDLLTPNKILANQSIRQQDASIKQFLIQWNNKPVEEATWEEELTLKSKFPNFSLEDKTVLDLGEVGGACGSKEEGPVGT